MHFAHIEILLIAGLVCVIGFVGWYVWQSKNKANVSLNNAAKADTPTKVSVIKKPASTAAQASTPTPTTNSSPTTTVKKSAPNSNNSTPAPTPPAPTVLTPSLTISANGCSVTANGSQGFILYVTAYNASKGGESTYTLPASATMTVQTGNVQGMTVETNLKDSNGNMLIQKTGTITAQSCY